MAPDETVSAHMAPSRAQNQVILHDLRHDRYGETGFHCRRSSAKKQLERLAITWKHLIDKKSLKISILEQILIDKAEQFFRDLALAPARTTPCGGGTSQAIQSFNGGTWRSTRNQRGKMFFSFAVD